MRIIKRAIKIFTLLAILAIVIHIVHALTLDRRIQYVDVSFYSTQLPPVLDGYTVAFITDTHYITAEHLQGIAEHLNARNVDLLLLGGDYRATVGGTWQTMGILSQIRTTDGIYFVEGNNDNHYTLKAVAATYDMHFLSNSGLYIHERFFLAGVTDPWKLDTPSPSIATAISGAEQSSFILLLSHNPDVTMWEDTTAVNLVLSGHTHGGKVTFFGIWAPQFTFSQSVTQYGQRFRSGWATTADGTAVYVSNGTGGYHFPESVPRMRRVFARPQVIIITLRYS